MIVIVYFDVTPAHREDFLTRVLQQAADSLALEPACKRFDVAVDGSDQNRVLLYEIYDSAEDFAEHLRSAHFKAFDSAVASWVVSKRVETWEGPVVAQAS